MCHIIGIEPQFENIIKNGPFIPMVAGQRKPEGQWTRDERKAANLDQRLKSLIMVVLPDDQMNSKVGVMDLKLCYNTFKFKEGETLTQTFTRYKALMNELVNDGIKLSKLEINTDSELASLFGKLKYEENLIDNIYETEKNKSLVSATPLSTAFFSTSSVQDFQDSPDDEEDTRTSHEYLNDLEEEYQARALLAKSKRFFKKGTQRPTKDFEAKYNKVNAKLALLSSSATAYKASTVKNKCLIAEAYEWDEEEVSSDNNKMVEVKVLMALDEDNDDVSKEGAKNGEWVKISIRKVHTLLEMEDNDDRKTYLDYLCIDLNYVKEQRNNLLSKHRDLVHELNACKEHLLILKQAKLDFLIMQHINTKILKENKNAKDLVFVKSSADESKVSIPSVERPWLSKAEATEYDLADKSSVCSTPLPPLKKLNGVEPTFGPKTIKSILRSKSIFKAETLKGAIINEPSSAPVKGNKNSSASIVNSAPASKLKSVKIKDDPPLAIVMKELNNLKL
ncbi:hypothetical protein Tco_0157856 [Tanacetum coccineum]